MSVPFVLVLGKMVVCLGRCHIGEPPERVEDLGRWPEVGDYVIVHAGFAIHSMIEEEAKKNIELIREMASHMPEELLLAGDDT